LISRKDAERLNHDIDAMRRQSQVVGGAMHERVFTIEISKYEYCAGKMTATVGAYDCLVYTPVMIAAEKMRAICQQMPDYPHRKHPAPRARDFYDIHSIVSNEGIELSDGVELIEQMFSAKDVPLAYLAQVPAQREFHRNGWPAVQNAVRVALRPFDDYFDFVVAEAQKLHALWYP
jgi:hypothetical protein